MHPEQQPGEQPDQMHVPPPMLQARLYCLYSSMQAPSGGCPVSDTRPATIVSWVIRIQGQAVTWQCAAACWPHRGCRAHGGLLCTVAPLARAPCWVLGLLRLSETAEPGSARRRATTRMGLPIPSSCSSPSGSCTPTWSPSPCLSPWRSSSSGRCAPAAEILSPQSPARTALKQPAGGMQRLT